MEIEDGDAPSRFAAFISYRHVEPDRRWARWLHNALETYTVPERLRREGLPARVGKVFRDEEEVWASDSLSAQITQALDESRFLVVVCSPRAPASKWVNREIEEFRTRGRASRVLALLIDGSPEASFPEALRAIRPTGGPVGGPSAVDFPEPLAADARPVAGESRSAQRRLALLRILAPVLGCRFDELRQRDQERQRRRARRTAVLFAALASALGGLSAYALNQRSQVRDERDRVAASMLVASERLGDLREEAGRDALVRGDIDRATRLLLDAYAEQPGSPARQVLLGEALARTRGLRRTLSGRPEQVEQLRPSADGSVLFAAPTWGQPVVAWDLSRTEPVATVRNMLFGTVEGWATQDGRLAVTLRQHGDSVRAQVVTLPGGEPSPHAFYARGNVVHAVLGGDGALLLTLVHDNASRTSPDALLWDVKSGEKRREISGPWDAGAFARGSSLVVLLSRTRSVVCDARDGTVRSDLGGVSGTPPRFLEAPDGDRGLVITAEGARLVDLSTGATTAELPKPPTGAGARGTGFSPRGAWIVCPGAAGDLRVLSAGTGAEAARAPEEARPLSWSFAPDDTLLALHDVDGRIHLLDTQSLTWRTAAAPARGSPAALAVGVPTAFDARGEHLLWGTDSGDVAVLRVRDGASVAAWDVAEGLSTLAFGHDPDQVVTAGRDGTLRVWAWREAQGVRERSLPVPQGISRVVVGARPRTVHVAAHTGELLAWDVDGEAAPLSVRATDGPLLSFVPFADGSRLLLAPYYTGVLRVVDARTLGEVASLSPVEATSGGGVRVGGMETVWAAVASRGGRAVSFGSSGVALWSLDPLEARRPLQVFPREDRQAVLGALGTTLLTRSGSGRVTLWRDRGRGFAAEAAPDLDPLGWPSLACLSPEEDRVALMDDSGRMHLLSLDGAASPAHLSRTPTVVTSMAFDPTGRRLLSAEGDGSVRVWDGRSGALLHALVVRGERAEDPNTFRAPVFTMGPAPHAVTAMEADRQGEFLLVAHGDQWVRLWDVVSGRLALSWRTDSPCSAVGFLDDTAIVLVETSKVRCLPLRRERRAAAAVARDVSTLPLRR
ncbi:MAG: TIR domain-containing protein [Planctomycetes bacterium]|nr:TIR domain-containing protein [Planctomycetota bacterium]